MRDKGMLRIKFRYHDRYTKGEWNYGECEMSSVKECIEFYGLNVDCDKYEILAVEEV